MDIDARRFLTKLVEKGVIDDASSKKYEFEATANNENIDIYLEKLGTINPDELLKSKADLMGIPYINIASTAIDPQALTYIPKMLAQQYHVIPYLFDSTSKKLYVATSNPLNLEMIEEIESKTNLKVVPILALENEVVKALNTAYSLNLSPIVKEAVADIAYSDGPSEIQTTQEFNTAPIAKIVNTIVEFAIKSRASDIHIEPQADRTRVRYRIDGILLEKLSLPRTIHDSLVSRVKILGGMKIDERRIPQDGRFDYKMQKEEIDLRLSTLPTVNGEKIVMRLLRKTGGLPSLPELGLDGVQLKRFEEGMSRSYGIVLVTGPTGSGKTTTLYSVLTKLNTKAVNIVTLEDPVEYQLEGINQVQINAQAGLTFANGLKSFLRQDPNIILVGEVRDTETTQLAVQAALTGHLVFSTLHTNDAATAIPRLKDLGGEAFLIASVLNIALGQRIVRKVCTHCREIYQPAPEIQQAVKQVLGPLLPKQYSTQPIMLARGRGCDECNHSGYIGRIGIFEILKTSPTINGMIMRDATTQEIEKQAISEGMILMKQDGYLKSLNGITTIEEVMRVTES